MLSQKLQRGALWVELGAMAQLLATWGDDAHREVFMARTMLMVLPPLLLMQFECWTVWRRGLANRNFSIVSQSPTPISSSCWQKNLGREFSLKGTVGEVFAFPPFLSSSASWAICLAVQRQQRSAKLPACNFCQATRVGIYTKNPSHLTSIRGCERRVSPKWSV